MGFAELRKLLQPLSFAGKILISTPISSQSPSLFAVAFPILGISRSTHIFRFSPASCFRQIYSLTDTRFPKRRPVIKPRKKRVHTNRSGPFAWLQYVPGEPIPRSCPNEGTVKGRKRRRRIKERKAFILSEKKKRKAEMQESNRKKRLESVERKKAAVEREKAWVVRFAELQRLENEEATNAALGNA